MKPKSETKLAEFICSTCQKPISLKARSDVTRFLSFESRCMCQDDETTVPPRLVEVADETSSIQLGDVQAVLGDKYEVLGLLRAGGTGDVYKVHDKNLDKMFAVKLLHADLAADINTVKFFQQQAKDAQDLTHANLAAVYGANVAENGTPYIIMDYLDGDTLAEELSTHGFLDVPRALDIFIQMAEALAHGHTKGVTHHDLKPTNVVLCKGSGGQDFVKLVDFGIARSLTSTGADGQTTTGGRQKRSSGSPSKPVAGSPRYMSPEHCLSRPLDARSDIYSMGCIMYEALTNVPVFEDKNPIRTMVKQVGSKPRPFAELKHEYAIPGTLEQVVFRCLEKNPSGRYQSAQDLMVDLQRVKNGQELVQPQRIEEPPRFWSKRNQLIAAGSLLALLVTVWFAGAQIVQSKFKENARVTVPPPAVKQQAPGGAISGTDVIRPQARHRANAPTGDLTTTDSALNGDASHDAAVMDKWASRYWHHGDHKQAAPMLEFVISAYNDGLLPYNETDEDRLALAERCRQLAKSYVALNEPERAVPHIREAIFLSQQSAGGGDSAGLIDEYARILNKLGRSKAATEMQADFARHKKLTDIP